MNKRIKQYWYTTEKYTYHRKPVIFQWANGTTEHHFTLDSTPDGTLLAMRRYPTKLYPSDLPPTFFHARIHKTWGYVDCSRVSDMAYIPNNWINHLFRDDDLLLLFDGKLFDEEVAKYQTEHREELEKKASSFMLPRDPRRYVYDLAADGWNIIKIATRVGVFTGFDTGEIYQQIKDKVKLYSQTHPEEHDCISLEEFEYIWDKSLQEAIGISGRMST